MQSAADFGAGRNLPQNGGGGWRFVARFARFVASLRVTPSRAGGVRRRAVRGDMNLYRTIRSDLMRIVVNIDVPELQPAIEFYQAALGLAHARTLDDDVAELTGGSSVIYLLAKDAGTKPSREAPDVRRYANDASRAQREPGSGRHWTPVHIDFVVDNIEAAARRAVAAGAKRESECVEWRGSKCITFADPFGHGFCLIEFAGETYA
jgi:predicted enzyme related to lactoylglutathione lyase